MWSVGPPTRFVGRERELRVVEQLLDRARSGGSTAVAVVGEQGIGKTRLLQELGRMAGVSGCPVLTGHGSEFEVEAPFGLIVEALDDAVGDLDPVVLKRLGDDRLAELGVVFPSLAGVGGRLSSSLEIERYRCHYAVRAALQLLVRAQPMTLVLDDLHWADPASVELVCYLLRRGVPGCLLALTYRPYASRSLVSEVALAAREGALRVLELGPLSPEEAASMLGEAMVPASRAALYAESGGNPFYLEQLVRAAKSRADLLLPAGARRTDMASGVPAIVQAVIDQELAGLSSRARQLAHGAAVAGDPFDLDLAREIVELDQAGGAAALDELVRASLVYSTDVPGCLRFRHPITRRAVYDATGHGWRLLAHRQAAEALARRGGSAGLQAQHIVRSAPSVGDEAAISLLEAAAEQAAPRAPAAAAHWLETAVRLLPADAAVDRRIGLLVPLAKAFATAGQLQDSKAVLRQAIDVAPPEDTGGRMRLTILLAGVEQSLGAGEEARRLLEAALAETSPGTRESGELLLQLAVNRMGWGEWDDAVETAHTAVDLAQALGDQDLVIQASAVLGVCEAWRLGAATAQAAGIAGQMDAHLDQAADGLAAVPDDKMTPSLLDALDMLARAEISLERWEDARHHEERGIHICRATGDGQRFLDFMTALQSVHLLRGRLAEARQLSDTVSEALQLVDNDRAMMLNETLRCWITSVQGHTQEALAAGERSLRAAERTPHSQYTGLAHMTYGLALVEAGQFPDGRDRILAAGGPELADVGPSIRPHFLRALVEAELALGELEEAEEAAARAKDIATHSGLTMRKGDAAYAEAMIFLTRGQVTEGLAEAEKATKAYEAAQVPIEAGRGRMLVARALVDAGDEERAVEELEAAHRVFVERGAVRLADRAAQELRRLGRNVARKRTGEGLPAVTGPASLSPREQEVASLVAEGNTTRQIAEELFLSPKTIETHLAHIFAKLGVSSRAAMTAALARAQIADP